MLISELAKEVHENAVAHGWWDENRQPPEILALIHSEWSEALEEARAGRPLAYIIVHDGWQGDPHDAIIERGQDGKYIHCGKEYSGKPEGVAVELIDGCIRILDYIGKLDVITPGSDESDMPVERLYEKMPFGDAERPWDNLPGLIAYLHLYTSGVLNIKEECPVGRALQLLLAMSYALTWVKFQGLDPLAILLEKHAYNKTRPYKHGKKF